MSAPGESRTVLRPSGRDVPSPRTITRAQIKAVAIRARREGNRALVDVATTAMVYQGEPRGIEAADLVVEEIAAGLVDQLPSIGAFEDALNEGDDGSAQHAAAAAAMALRAAAPSAEVGVDCHVDELVECAAAWLAAVERRMRKGL